MPANAVVDVRNSLGAIFIAVLVSTTLLGVIFIQTWMYYWHYRKDRKTLKFFVGFVVFTETVYTVICAYAIYWFLVLNFGNVDVLRQTSWAMIVQAIVSAISGSAVQFFYARRIYILSESWIVPAIVVAFVATGDVLTIYSAVKSLSVKRFPIAKIPTWISYAGMSGLVLIDVLIAATMCLCLYRKKTGFAKTDSIIVTLMSYTINSGALTSVLGAAMAISFMISPHSMVWMAIYWVMSKCYVMSMLVMLNSRDYIRGCSSTSQDNAITLSSIRIEPLGGSRTKQTDVSVSVHCSTTSDFAQTKSDTNIETLEGPAFEIPKPDTSIIQSRSRTSEVAT